MAILRYFDVCQLTHCTFYIGVSFGVKINRLTSQDSSNISFYLRKKVTLFATFPTIKSSYVIIIVQRKPMTRTEASTMFLRILKKDLKLKNTMNVILLTFMILCSTFAPESVNNSITMSGSLDYYFEKAGDYYLFTHNGNGERNLEKLIEYDFQYQFELL